MKTVRRFLEELYYIPYCSVCDSAAIPPLPSPHICRDCLSTLPFRMGKEKVTWEGAFPLYASLFYRDPVPRMVVSLKFSDRTDRANAMAPLLARTVERHHLFFDAIVPVPLHVKRERERGYNQAALIAGSLSEILALPVIDGWLVRDVYTEPQSLSQTMKERFLHLKDAFTLEDDLPVGHFLSGRHVLLVDDVLTTGATLSAAAAPLIAAGMKVTGLVAASDKDRYDGYREALEAYF